MLPTSLLFATREASAQLEPDHLYVWVSPNAPEGAALRALGIAQSPDTVRLGEGVEWITFVLDNLYIELLWVADADAFREHWVSWHPQHAERARWRKTGASPFGLAFHRVDPGGHELPVAFRVTDWWDADGGYVSDVPGGVPFLMVMGPRYALPDPEWMRPETRSLPENATGIRRLTGWTLGMPDPPGSRRRSPPGRSRGAAGREIGSA